MPTAILPLIRAAAPYLLATFALLAVWAHGYHTADKSRVAFEARIKAQSEIVTLQAEKRQAQVAAEIAQSNIETEEKAHAAKEIIDQLSDRNSQLLAERLRRDRAGSRCRALPDHPATAAVGDDPAAGGESFLESAGKRLVAEAARADAISESLRACQRYVVQVNKSVNR